LVIGHEDPQLIEIATETPSGQPPCAAQGPRLHHQQDQSALQSSPGLKFSDNGFVITAAGNHGGDHLLPHSITV
jgi:hypothetical protein